MDKKTLLLRDDDVWRIDAAFTAVFEFCLEQKIPVVYGVIPAKAKVNLARLLNKTKSRNPHLIDIVQHGWQHKNHNPGGGEKYEFGPRRSYNLQKKDIEKGLAKMRRLFGRNFTPAFIPPYHGYDMNTLKIIRECGFKIFSAGKEATTQKSGILDLPARFSLNSYDKAAQSLICHSALTLINKLTRYLDTQERSLGMVFHHYTLENRSQINEMLRFLLFLKDLSRQGYIALKLFSDQ